MKTWKKNMVAAAVLIAVCAGIYVNWLYTEDQTAANLTDTLDADKIMSSDMLAVNDMDSLLSGKGMWIVLHISAIVAFRLLLLRLKADW